MKKLQKSFLTILTMALVFAVFSLSSVAAGDAKVVSSRTTEDAVYIYLDGVEDTIEGCTVQVGTTICENVEISDIRGQGIPVKTIMLLDNSNSIETHWKKGAADLMNGVIDSMLDGEEIKIATYGAELNLLADFTTDKAAAHSAVAAVSYKYQDSYLMEVLRDILETIKKSNDNAFYRIIIICDGADHNTADQNYTPDEIRELIKSSGVQVNTIGVDAGDKAALETLFSFARAGAGYYELVTKADDSSKVSSGLSAYQAYKCIKLIPEAEIMDGSSREAKINIDTAAEKLSVTTTLRLPFGTGSKPVVEEPTPTIEEKKEPTPTPVKERPDPAPKEEKKSMSTATIVLFIVIGLVAVAVIVVIVLLLVKGKKQEEDNLGIPLPEKPITENPLDNGIEHTVLLGNDMETPEHSTMGLFDEIKKAPTRFLVLVDESNPMKQYSAPFVDERVIIGRVPPSNIVLGHDQAVSSQHCMVYQTGGRYVVKHLGNSNPTVVNGNITITRDDAEVPVVTGSTLKLGHSVYTVTIKGV